MSSHLHDVLEIISRGAQEILKIDELEARLKTGKPLRVKAGFDGPGSFWFVIPQCDGFLRKPCCFLIMAFKTRLRVSCRA